MKELYEVLEGEGRWVMQNVLDAGLHYCVNARLIFCTGRTFLKLEGAPADIASFVNNSLSESVIKLYAVKER